MRKIILFGLIMFSSLSIYAQKQTTPYFEFTYNCVQTDMSYNSERKSWSYEYENEKDEVFIAIDVKINPRGEDYPKSLIDALVVDLGYVKTTIGTFKKLYAAISVGEVDGLYLKKATFSTKSKMYIVSVVGQNDILTHNIYKQLEQTFITK